MKIIIVMDDGFVIDTIMNIQEYNLDSSFIKKSLLSKLKQVIEEGKKNEKHDGKL